MLCCVVVAACYFNVNKDQWFQHLELREREYFGIVFCEGGSVLASGPAPDVTRWLDPAKLIRKIYNIDLLDLE